MVITDILLNKGDEIFEASYIHDNYNIIIDIDEYLGKKLRFIFQRIRKNINIKNV